MIVRPATSWSTPSCAISTQLPETPEEPLSQSPPAGPGTMRYKSRYGRADGREEATLPEAAGVLFRRALSTPKRGPSSNSIHRETSLSPYVLRRSTHIR